MRAFSTRATCALFRHDWNWRAARGTDLPYRCDRCGRFDDEPKIVRAAKRRAWLGRWSPVTFKITRREISVCVGVPWHPRIPSLSVRAAVHYGFERSDELPGISARINVWRLRIGGHLGGGWQDEDGDGRALFRLWADFTTYGLRWIGCWFGHKPETSELLPGWISCARCDEVLVRPKQEVAVGG